MNTLKKVGIWISKEDDIIKIPDVKKHIEKFSDIFIVTDQFLYCPDYAIIHYFYATFEDMIVVFFSVDDLIENKDKFRSHNLMLFCSAENLSELNKNMLSNVKVVTL